MNKLTEKEKIEYNHQNFIKTDGLWFIKVEEKFGFEKALELDREVWKILPKMQARFLKNKMGLNNSFEDLLKALKQKMELDGYRFRTTITGIKKDKSIIKHNNKINSLPKKSIHIKISHCPWHEIMLKAKREKLSAIIGSTICKTEYTAFAREFIKDISVIIKNQICHRSKFCTFQILLKN